MSRKDRYNKMNTIFKQTHKKLVKNYILYINIHKNSYNKNDYCFIVLAVLMY
jgi:hypothetical protein